LYLLVLVFVSVFLAVFVVVSYSRLSGCGGWLLNANSCAHVFVYA
jgi:hypothetical protein